MARRKRRRLSQEWRIVSAAALVALVAGVAAVAGAASVSKPWLFAGAMPIAAIGFFVPGLFEGRNQRERSLWAVSASLLATLLGIVLYHYLDDDRGPPAVRGDISEVELVAPPRHYADLTGNVSDLPDGDTAWLVQRSTGSYDVLAPVQDIDSTGRWSATCVVLYGASGGSAEQITVILLAVSRADSERFLLGELDPLDLIGEGFGMGFDLDAVEAAVLDQVAVTLAPADDDGDDPPTGC